jgi:hypothetical protein
LPTGQRIRVQFKGKVPAGGYSLADVKLGDMCVMNHTFYVWAIPTGIAHNQLGLIPDMPKQQSPLDQFQR